MLYGPPTFSLRDTFIRAKMTRAEINLDPFRMLSEVVRGEAKRNSQGGKGFDIHAGTA
jgi:hypothetical protein